MYFFRKFWLCVIRNKFSSYTLDVFRFEKGITINPINFFIPFRKTSKDVHETQYKFLVK